MDHHELRTFLAIAQQHRPFAFFHVAAYTGARRGELLNLRWKDIDLDGKKITITGSTAVIAGERVNETTKSSKQLPHARLHDLRHLHAITLLLSNVPSTLSQRGSATPTRLSPSASTPT